jgi:hypothetical protein
MGFAVSCRVLNADGATLRGQAMPSQYTAANIALSADSGAVL